MTEQIHRAAQYLATANMSFLEKKEDDSHTNLGFNASKGFLETWPLNEQGHILAFDYALFALHWITDGTIAQTLLLDGKSHAEIVQWISETTRLQGLSDAYAYRLHYDLPYDEISDSFRYVKPKTEQLQQLRRLRTVAQSAMEKVVHSHKLKTAIRLWPHHFDTGGFVALDGISIGFGMAIPDSLVNDFYLYTSGYRGHEQIDTGSFAPLSLGHWVNDGFKGGLMPMTPTDEATAVRFLEESISKYLTLQSN